MRNIKAVFIKQAKDMFKNPMVLTMFIIFPLVALIMSELVAKSNDDISNNMFVTMMAAIFIGMTLINTMAGILGEDIERKSLRFLIMAGVKPHQYLFGVGGFILLAATITSIIFTLIGNFTNIEILKFLIIMIAGAAASIILGASIGMLSKNQQVASSIGMPIAVIFGFTPMIASFNETVEKFASILYTQQINVIVNDFSISLFKPLLVCLLNILVFLLIFVFAYKKKGLKG